MDRVVILGRGGAGKSVLGRAIAARTGIPVVELDAVFWNEALEPLTRDEWTERQTVFATQPRWIMDGDLGPYDALEPRLRRSDTVVMLDLPLWLCAWRACRRGRERRDFWEWTLRWRRDSRGHLLDNIAEFAPAADVIVLKNRRSIRRWLADVES